MHMKTMRHVGYRSAAGYALLEALIAVIVASVGFIGAARMQTLGMKFGNSAQSRQKATLLAYQMTDRIRANREGFKSEGYSNAADNASGSKACLSDAAGCGTPALMAAADLREWLDDVAAQLPAGQGVVCKDSTANDAADLTATLAAPGCDNTGDTIAVKIWWTDGVAATRFVTMVRP